MLKITSRPYITRDQETKFVPLKKVDSIAPIPIAIILDIVVMKFNAIVHLERNFPHDLYLGRQNLRCYNIVVHDTRVDARIDERDSLVLGSRPPSKSQYHYTA